jgi:four helix bundle protein
MSRNGNHTEFDLEERTAKFGEAVISFAKRLPTNPVSLPLISQLVRAATSVGANYCEANDAQTKKEFRHRISICRKEAKESKHWLRMMVTAVEESRIEARTLWIEAKELNLIFSAILRTSAA